MGLGMACRSFRRIWPMLELRVPPRLFPSRLPTLRLWSPWLLPSGVRTLRLCACEFWWRFRSRHGRGFPRRRRAPLDLPMSAFSPEESEVATAHIGLDADVHVLPELDRPSRESAQGLSEAIRGHQGSGHETRRKTGLCLCHDWSIRRGF